MREKHPAAVELGRRGGAVKSAAKTAAAQANGVKGGRPVEHTAGPAAVRRRAVRARQKVAAAVVVVRLEQHHATKKEQD